MDKNLQSMLDEVEGLFDRKFEHKGKVYKFYGIVIGGDDYYYGMYDYVTGRNLLLTGVGNLTTHEFKLIEE